MYVPVKNVPNIMAVRPIGALLNSEGRYGFGQPKTMREFMAWPTGMKKT